MAATPIGLPGEPPGITCGRLGLLNSLPKADRVTCSLRPSATTRFASGAQAGKLYVTRAERPAEYLNINPTGMADAGYGSETITPNRMSGNPYMPKLSVDPIR